MKENPNNIKGLYRKGKCLMKLGEFLQAKEIFEAGLKLEPQNEQFQKGIDDCIRKDQKANKLQKIICKEIIEKMPEEEEKEIKEEKIKAKLKRKEEKEKEKLKLENDLKGTEVTLEQLEKGIKFDLADPKHFLNQPEGAYTDQQPMDTAD